MANRDDFIIAIRSAFLKKGTQQRFSLISLIFLSIFLLSLEKVNFKIIDKLRITVNELVYRTSYIVSLPENGLKKLLKGVGDHFNHYNEFHEVKYELDLLKSKDLSKQIILLENEKLKKIIDDYFITDSEIFAKVLIDKDSPFLRSVVLNKGSKNNIKLGMAVLDEDYLIGKVVEVNFSTSRVLLLSDLNAKIPVTLEPGDAQAIMSGTGENDGILQYSKENYPEKIDGDIIVFTSGAGGLFKSGIPIGTIQNQDSTNSNEKKVKFFSDFTQLKYVKVKSYSKEKIDFKKNNEKQTQEIQNKIFELQELKESNNILVEEKKISEEIRIKIEEENIQLKNSIIKLKKDLALAKNVVEQYKIKEEEIRFLELNLIYGSKCKKTFYNNLYKVGTKEYRNCVLNKGQN